ncbi:MAG: hypothetical protein AAFV07_20080 [Bacteroidota bacterium]
MITFAFLQNHTILLNFQLQSMHFSLMPLFEDMLMLYNMPPGRERFEAYLTLMRGSSNSKDDMVRPIGGYNPMAKSHVPAQLYDLITLGAEDLAREALMAVNQLVANKHPSREIQLGMVLADDLMGGWTFRHTTDYESKFVLNALVTRHLATTYIWTSESYTPTQIRRQVADYALRTVHWLDHPKPRTLLEHIAQEQFVAKHNPFATDLAPLDKPEEVQEVLDTFGEMEDYHLTLNLLYGDQAVEEIGHTPQGISEPMAGFRWAIYHQG